MLTIENCVKCGRQIASDNTLPVGHRAMLCILCNFVDKLIEELTQKRNWLAKKPITNDSRIQVKVIEAILHYLKTGQTNLLDRIK